MNKQTLLTGLALLLASATSIAGEVVFYINEDGQPASTISVTLGDDKKLVQPNGFVVFDLEAGDYSAELNQYGEWLGEVGFSLAERQNAEIKVDILGGEPMAEVQLFDNGDTTGSGQISGTLLSVETGGVVSGARVAVEGSDIATLTDDNGFFELTLPRGEYNLTIAHPNYGNRSLSNVRVFANLGLAMNVELSMSGTGMIEEMVATGSYIPNTTVAHKRDASTILDSIGSEQFSKFGDTNAAAALKRVSGVSITGGQYAIIRGLTGRYNASTMNDGLLPSTNPLSRDVPLDLFPAGVLEGIEIKKGYTPELFGDSTGGTINMVTKGLPDARINRLALGLGYRTGVTFKDVVSYDGGDTDYLGIDDGTRELPASIDSATDFGQQTYNICNDPSVCLTVAQVAALASDFENIYNVGTTWAAPDFDFALSHGDLIEGENGNFGYYGDITYKTKWEARQDAKIDDLSGQYDYDRSKQSIDLSTYLVMGYQDAVGNHEVLSKTMMMRKTDDITRRMVGEDSEGTRITDVILQWVERQYLGQTFSGEHYMADRQHQLNWRMTAGLSSRYEPDRRSYQYRNDMIFPSTLERRFAQQDETSVDFGLDYTWHWQLDNGMAGRVKAGLFVASKERETELGRFGFNQGPGVDTTGMDLESLLIPANFLSGDFVMQVRTAKTDSYEATDEMMAYYISTETDFSPAWSLLLGLRFEDASQELRYPNSPATDSLYETDEVLPALALTWRATDNWQLRAGVSQTVSRPGLTERSLTSQYDPETDEQVFGNANLVLSNITNIDFRAEYYFNDVDSVSVALFTKLIDNPIERTVPDASGSASDGYTFANQDEATVSGIELDMGMTVLDKADYRGMLSGNLAFIDSEVTLANRSIALEGIEERQLQGQSDILANLQFSLEHLPTAQTVTFLVNYFDDRIYKVLRGSENEIEEGRATVDVVYKYQHDEQLSFGARIQNLFDEKVRYSIDDDISESYREGVYIKGSMTYNF